MKILVYGLTYRWGLPLAVALRDYGRHSVVGWNYEVNTPRSPDQAVQALLDHLPIPVAPTLDVALTEGNDLVFVACYPELVQAALDRLADKWAPLARREGPLICVVVTPVSEREIVSVHPSVLSIGYAPFLYRPERTLERLLSLRKIDVTHLADRHHPWRGGLLARSAVANAWTPIDNKIPIREQTILVGGQIGRGLL